MNAFLTFADENLFPLVLIFFVAGLTVLYILAYSPPQDPADVDPQDPASGSRAGTTVRPGHGATAQSQSMYRDRLPARQTLRITRCFDSQMWYAEHIGKNFDVFRQEYWPKEDMIVYWVRTPGGTTNWVNDRDCVVTVHPKVTLHPDGRLTK